MRQTGEPELRTDVSDEWLREIAADDQQLDALRALELRSNILVPLIARGRTLGVLTLATAESGRVYGEADLALRARLLSGLGFPNALRDLPGCCLLPEK